MQRQIIVKTKQLIFANFSLEYFHKKEKEIKLNKNNNNP